MRLVLGRGDVGAGNIHYSLVFTNTSGRTCVLSGYPGVSHLAGDGAQIGAPAKREGGAGSSVRLAPGAKAHSEVHTLNGGVGGPLPGEGRTAAGLPARLARGDDDAGGRLPRLRGHLHGDDAQRGRRSLLSLGPPAPARRVRVGRPATRGPPPPASLRDHPFSSSGSRPGRRPGSARSACSCRCGSAPAPGSSRRTPGCR
ncbi:DUF4232 domain-containing protein [Streptomyces sp. SA3_actF]|uniref:DUF4232 domain-containing protein n=1 Tax=Streptomyces sp. SA3_actF TaxID=682181 RepID=UPI001F3BC1B6|nr:DUF4232 domain-containing protein [Streptomyces sp. SA3_actF]